MEETKSDDNIVKEPYTYPGLIKHIWVDAWVPTYADEAWVKENIIVFDLSELEGSRIKECKNYPKTKET